MDAYAFIQGTDHVCYRYRLKQYMPLLAAYGVRVVPVVLGRRTAGRWWVLRSQEPTGTCLLQRRLLDRVSLRLLRNLCDRLLFDIDDAVAFRDGLDGKGYFSPRKLARFQRTVEQADTVIAGNVYLAGLAREAGARDVLVIPTAVDVHRYMAASRSRTDDRVRIVWIGSRSTLRYLARLRPVFEWLCRALPNRWTLRVICDRFPDWPGVPMERICWREDAEVQALVSADIGIAPMTDDRWTRGKCGLKLLQYMAAALPVVASPVGVQPEIVCEGHTGLLAHTARDWVDALAYLIAEPEARVALGRAGRARCLQRYDIHVWAEALAKALLGPDRERSIDSSTQAA